MYNVYEKKLTSEYIFEKTMSTMYLHNIKQVLPPFGITCHMNECICMYVNSRYILFIHFATSNSGRREYNFIY